MSFGACLASLLPCLFRWFLPKHEALMLYSRSSRETVDDGSIIDTKGWHGWEWTHGIALTALYHVSIPKTSANQQEYREKASD